MNPLLEWKDLLALATGISGLLTGISGLLFSLAAYRRAKAAEERSVRAERQALLDAIVGERERALGEIHAIKAAWSGRRAMLRLHDPSDTEFDRIVDSQMSVLNLAESSIRALAPQMTSHEDLVRFRTNWMTSLQEMRAQDAVVEKVFGEHVEQLKAKTGPHGKERSDT